MYRPGDRNPYKFYGWCSEPVAIDSDCNATYYNNTLTVDANTEDKAITLYAILAPYPDLIIKAGDGIENIIVAHKDLGIYASSAYYYDSDSYSTVGKTNTGDWYTARDIVISAPDPGTKFIVTVIPKPGYKLSKWQGLGSLNLEDRTLLTTTYTVPENPFGGSTMTAVGEPGSYTAIKDFTKADCSTATNVTDERDGKSYTVAPVGNSCYMLSDLRLDFNWITPGYGRPLLTPDTTNISEDWLVPNYDPVEYSSRNQIYSYTWDIAKARPVKYIAGEDTIIEESLGDICPAGWTLPTYTDDIAPSDLRIAYHMEILNNGALMSTSENNYKWRWLSSDEYDADHVYVLSMKYSVEREVVSKSAYHVRCRRKD